MIGVRGSGRELRASALGVLLALALLPACAASLARPASGKVPNDEMIEVPYPPPPARVETIPEKKRVGQVWLDGQWEWDGKAWKWRDGAWTTPPPDANFTPCSTRRRGDGQLLFTRAEWRDKQGRPLNVSTDGQICSAPAPVAQAKP